MTNRRLTDDEIREILIERKRAESDAKWNRFEKNATKGLIVTLIGNAIFLGIV